MSKNYFSFFGILIATVTNKMHDLYCQISSIMTQKIPKINKLLLAKQLKPIKLYSTNHI